MQKIGLFGGSFDPIHFGHINLAFELMEKRELDKVWFLPTQISPHKLNASPVAIKHRLAMLHLATEDIPQFKVDDIEEGLPSPSFTVRTLQALMTKEALSHYQFYLILGEDSIPGFFQWYMPQEIIKLVPLLIGSRSGVWNIESAHFDSSIKDAIQKGLTPTRLMDISSTDLKKRLSQGLYCEHLVPAKVLHYIHQNKLYQNDLKDGF